MYVKPYLHLSRMPCEGVFNKALFPGPRLVKVGLRYCKVALLKGAPIKTAAGTSRPLFLYTRLLQYLTVHQAFYFVRFDRHGLHQVDVAVARKLEIVFDPDAQLFILYIDAGLNGEDHSCL
ncbi:hypothetical protein SAMN04487894_106255 [Niabella drilacis]|uniref:Uncharacterized protein n=1 Tax=Niabella drilacis (strain DSM 25811 / CCM 8410 / CCUG 62505 / LMG 26954 / E90) TaxID=1285928 RepID=A0A1G6SJI6_NIADE|nr:hypothetical protein SAMN04487894_106255 [Niabella drilacis]